MRELISFCSKYGVKQNLMQHELTIKISLREHLIKLP